MCGSQAEATAAWGADVSRGRAAVMGCAPNRRAHRAAPQAELTDTGDANCAEIAAMRS
ncbi:hypothetical protein ACFPES_13745 [Paenibacillus sp. GCM10023248]|uniref:hypothetical protein n=1 Tax=unclassified Paenibacillus TaxID=185978 RepID=UPI0023787A68|nr:hypothetical protein [Paenibacillus sp. MAHUQ-63]MDD9268097.1 hypothetical protein [Paenibacillus sp. MAHUQ-63]